MILLNAFIKKIGLAGTGGQAKLLIRSGKVKVNSEIETRNKKQLEEKDIVEVDGKKFTVS
jgi:ribosome-associated protein